MTLQERVEGLKRAQAQLPDLLADIAQEATQRAVEKAAGLTPPTGGDLSGTNTRTGELKQHWAADSEIIPVRQGSDWVTILANDKEYASYVDQGHRMDRHFVPGLYVNPESGLLEYDPAAKVGLIVGAKTPYVPGVYMVDAAKEEYRRAVQEGSCRLEGLLE
ncbi:MAG: HK97 gp10 family phage protein [Flavonifractor sp.]|jgi:hypothetical protein|nr:HK97 gp10 family phage protein [Flavonifractor sp.]